MMHRLGHPRHGNRPKVFQGRASRVYDVMARRLLRRVYRRFGEDLAAVAPEGGTVLDVGTGPGVLLVELARLRPDLRLTGVDLSADMVNAAQRNLTAFSDRASAAQGDVTRLPFPDDAFDLIVSSLSLHHWDNPRAAAPELARVLRPDGQVYLYDFRFAPFAELIAAADGTSLSSAAAPRPTPIRVGVPFFPRIVRYVMSAASPRVPAVGSGAA
jgi:ubiquinone/menaquinone biosynthesis C-methylase UbiE